MLGAHTVETGAPMIAAASAGESTRRHVPPGGSVAPAAAAGPAAPGAGPGRAGGGATFAYTGRRTTRERNARGDGINVYRVDAATGRREHVQLVADLVNPSFLALDAAKRTLYTVHGDASEVSGFRIAPETGRLSALNRQSTRGKNPVHLAIDPTGRFIVVPDKGLDVVWTFRLDEDGKLHTAEPPFVQAREISGPRHVAFHKQKPLAYVINELDSTVTGYRYDSASGKLDPFQVIPSLPEGFTGNSRASEIAVSPDGRFVYASNRGFDSVAVFAVDPADGWLRPVEHQRSRGKTPRFFAIDPTGRFMFVANEDSDAIVTYAIDRETGKLVATGDVVETGSPVCIVFL